MTSQVAPAFGSALPPSLHRPIRSIVTSALKLGPRPSHVAFVMDGNRRLARRDGLKTLRGHELGFQALRGLLAFFLDLGVSNVTVYAFSIDNFARPADEVEGLMDLAKVKLLELAQKGQLLQEYGVRVYIIGKRELLPLDVQQACDQVEALTARNTAGSLNVCFPYTSTDEMSNAARSSTEHKLLSDDPTAISIADIERELYSSRSADFGRPDILIRTSGVCRLSDFLLWQTSIHFLRRMWPEIGVADMLPILLSWQAHHILRGIGLVR